MQMTLGEAIETLKSIVDMGWYIGKPADDDAIRLLIEAGKLVEGLRAGVPRNTVYLLPGEKRE